MIYAFSKADSWSWQLTLIAINITAINHLSKCNSASIHRLIKSLVVKMFRFHERVVQIHDHSLPALKDHLFSLTTGYTSRLKEALWT